MFFRPAFFLFFCSTQQMEEEFSQSIQWPKDFYVNLKKKLCCCDSTLFFLTNCGYTLQNRAGPFMQSFVPDVVGMEYFAHGRIHWPIPWNSSMHNQTKRCSPTFSVCADKHWKQRCFSPLLIICVEHLERSVWLTSSSVFFYCFNSCEHREFCDVPLSFDPASSHSCPQTIQFT